MEWLCGNLMGQKSPFLFTRDSLKLCESNVARWSNNNNNKNQRKRKQKDIDLLFRPYCFVCLFFFCLFSCCRWSWFKESVWKILEEKILGTYREEWRCITPVYVREKGPKRPFSEVTLVWILYLFFFFSILVSSLPLFVFFQLCRMAIVFCFGLFCCCCCCCCCLHLFLVCISQDKWLWKE